MGLTLWFVNVGYGDAIYAEASLGEGKTFRMLMDGGSAHKHGNLAALLDERQADALDLMVSTHLHEDHVAGLTLAARRLRRLGEFWCLCPPPDEAYDVPVDPGWGYYTRKMGESLNAWRRFWGEDLGRLKPEIRAASGPGRAYGLSVSGLMEGQVRHFGLGVHLEVLYTGGSQTADTVQRLRRLYAEPDRLREHVEAVDGMANEACMAFRLTVGPRRVLLPGDNLAGWWAGVPADRMQAGLLKLSHHGAADGTSAELVERVRPEAAVLSVGLDRTDRPEPETVQALGGLPLYRTETRPGDRYVQVRWNQGRLEVVSG